MTDRIIHYLESFPTPDAIAEECRRLGVKGYRRETCDCPVSKLLLVKFSQRVSVEPLDGEGIFRMYVSVDSLKTTGGPLPPAVNAFALAFDRGEYPDLVEG